MDGQKHRKLRSFYGIWQQKATGQIQRKKKAYELNLKVAKFNCQKKNQKIKRCVGTDSKKEILSSCPPCLDSQEEQLLPARTVCDCVCLLPLLLDLSLW